MCFWDGDYKGWSRNEPEPGPALPWREGIIACFTFFTAWVRHNDNSNGNVGTKLANKWRHSHSVEPVMIK